MKASNQFSLGAAVLSVAAMGGLAWFSFGAGQNAVADTTTMDAAVLETPMMAREVTMHSDPNCGCCGDWAAHLEAHGYQVTTDHSVDVFALKAEQGIPAMMRSCHTALIDGYVVEGHVPAEAIEAFLGMAQKPFGDRTIGISVPGMPHGSPGMETGYFNDYDVVAFTADGEAAVIHEVRF